MSTGIRVRFATVVLLLTEVYAFLMAIAFNLIVVRKLDPYSYGLWTTILSIYVPLWSIPGLWLWWISRFVAYGDREAASTGLFLNIVFASIAIPVYLVVSVAYSHRLGEALTCFLLMIPLAIADTYFHYLRAIVSVLKPELLSIYRLVYETSRVAIAFVTVVMLGLGVYGAILSMVIALILSLSTWGIYVARKLSIALRPRLRKDVIAKIRRGIIIPTINTIASFLMGLDRAIATALTGNTIISAYLGFALIPKNVVIRTLYAFTAPIYAKALRQPSLRDLLDVILIYTTIALPLAITVFSFPHTVVVLLNPRYLDAESLIVVATINAYLLAVSSILSSFAIGSSHEDAYGCRQKELVHSPLLKIPLANLVRVITTIISYIAILYMFYGIWSVPTVTLSMMIVESIGLTMYIAYIVYVIHRRIYVPDKRSIHEYVRDFITVIIAAIAMATALRLAVSLFPIHEGVFFETAMQIIIVSTPGLIVYAVMVLTLTQRVKMLISMMVKRILSLKKFSFLEADS